jgi:uncharacterized membrane protein
VVLFVQEVDSMERDPRMGVRSWRAGRAALAVGLVVALMAPAATLAQGTLGISTPYPAVSVQPGSSPSFDIVVTSSEARRVDLSVSGAPAGWTATLHGGGFSVDGVYVTDDESPDLRLDVKIPDDAPDGTTELTVTASADGLTARLVIRVTVAAQAGGSVEMTSDFPNRKGQADQAFNFSLTLSNDTPQELVFTLSATTQAAGWTLEAYPTGQTQAASFTVDPGGSQGITVNVDPARTAPSGMYEVLVQAVSGTFTAEQVLTVEITGNVALDLSTPDQRLSTTATAGSGREFTLRVSNTGTSPVESVRISASAPSGWTVTYDTETIESIAGGDFRDVVATITPASEAIAGDYVITFRASATEASDSADVRVTVETSPLWGIVGLLIIALVVGGLLYVFQRYGRR